MKILEWNIRHGGSKVRIDNIIESLFNHNPDTIVLTEFRNNESGTKIQRELSIRGWVNQAATNPPQNENGILIASNSHLTINEPSTGAPKAAHRWLDVAFSNHNLSLLGIHIPGVKDKWDKEDFWLKVCEFGIKNIHKRHIIIGDFNTGLKNDYEETPFKLSKYMRQLLDLGWIDTWRYKNPNGKEYTWYSNKNNGFRVDYALITPELKGVFINTYHSDYERMNNYSDHSPIIMEISDNITAL